ncbi:MAG: CehA/McbA family metallohydrolase [Candidatus Shapirobacteria bacterium]|nr:CehA/McbA family metallohydrolase [Candidatus Shapirobacteria bacterium]MDD4382587.1 CehA/McbA family metallohydrolase [Candidatus Shapirobacteria bacterium]
MVSKRKWLRFDLHMHTTKSDGKNITKEMLKTAKRRGLDVIAITDHNVPNKFNLERIRKKYGIYVISGCELSFLSGHLLVLGLDSELIEKKLKQYKIKEKTCSVIARKKTIRGILQYFVDNGALIIAAHPKIPTGMMSLRGNFLAELYEKGLIHGAEIHNDDIEKKFKRKLYRVWHNLAKKFVLKLEIPAYSNSDAHIKNRIGNRFNMIKLDDPTKLLETLKKGKIEIRHGTRSDL